MAPKRKQPSQADDDEQPEPAQEASVQDAVEASSPSITDDDDDDASSSDSFPSGDDDSSGEESSDDEEGEAFEQVDVDFGFYCPQEKDFQGLRTLLQGYLDGQQWACSDLVDAIIQQGSTSAVGSVIKCGDDKGGATGGAGAGGDDEASPIGVCTVLNLRRHASAPPLRQLRDFLLAHAGACRQRLEQAWDAPATGLVINERLVNCPPQLAQPLAESLFGEVAEAAADEELTQEQRGDFQLDHFLMVVQAYQEEQPQQHAAAAAAAAAASGKQPQQLKKKQRHKDGAGAAAAAAASVIHYLPEAECYQAEADWWFSFPSAGRLVGRDELQPCRVVMLVGAAGAARARKQLAALLLNAAT